ncbi:hypothetical protein H0H81_011420 [Sphagnurus paluster]|uniref:Uncharacterized protein n=1 Tax=Sphagnurus paluster TaxID=117069 RepID=A0A9P7KKH9_9AGAR|nr:hypothetical protein H0H81_011420 [Sphagnurus paluster]
MTTAANPSSLPSWIQRGFTTLYSFNTTASQFQSSFEALFSSDAEFRVNHRVVSLESFQTNIKNRDAAAIDSSIVWKELIEVPASESQAGTEIVAGWFVVTRSLKFLIRDTPAKTVETVAFSAKIAKDPSVQSGDMQRIVELFQTVSDQAAPIHLQGEGGTSITATAA